MVESNLLLDGNKRQKRSLTCLEFGRACGLSLLLEDIGVFFVEVFGRKPLIDF